MKRRSIFKIAALVIGVPILLLAIVLLYLNFADLSGWRDTVAELASDAIGRELKINGEFQPEIGFTTRVVATDITLANADWSNDPQMVSVDRLAGEIDLLSIFFGPITIGDAEIDGARVLFEVDGHGHFNWALGDGKPSESDGGEFEMVIGHALVNDLQLVYAGPDRRPLEAELSKLEITDDGTGMLDLDLAGSLDGKPIAISGRLGTFIGLINASSVEHDLEGRFADTKFSLQGNIGDLGSLTGVEGNASVSGPEILRITDSFGLDPVIEGPFTVGGSVRQSVAGSDFTLEAAASGMSTSVTGVTDSLTNPSSIDATVIASGPSIRTVGAITGVADLPDEEFSVSGGVRWEGFPITFKELEITVGDNTLSADGVLGAPPQMLGTDFTILGAGPSLSSFGGLAGIDLPNDTFSVSGRVARVANGLEVKNLEARIGRAEVSANGRVGDPPDYAGTDLSIHAAGPNIAHFNHLMGIELPAEPFTIDGRLAQGIEAITLEGVTARLGGTRLRVDGILRTAQGLSGTTLRIAARGPTAAQLRALTDLKDLPDEAWTITGGLAVLDSGLRLDAVSASVGSLIARADGRVATGRGAIGTTLKLHLEDPLLSHALSIFGLSGLPGQPVRVDGGLQIESSGYRLDSVTAAAGDIEMEIAGLITAAPDLDGTQVHLKAHGPRLSSVGTYLKQDGLPPTPFSVVGDLHATDGGYELQNVVAKVDDNRANIDGTLIPKKGFVGTGLQIEITAPDLRRAGRLAAGLSKLPELPAEPFTLTTHFLIDDAGYEIDGLHATLDRAVVAVDGRIGSAAKWVGTDLTVSGDGPDASLFKALTGVTIPVAPFKVGGHVQRTDAAFLFDHVAVQLGGHAINLHGSLGELPKLIGTDLEIHASGPDTGLIQELAGVPSIPDQPFELEGKFNGTPERFAARDFSLLFGASDIKGSFTVDITGKPDVDARLTSSHLDLSNLRERDDKKNAGTEDAAKPPDPEKRERLISDEPFDLAILHTVDADVEIRIDKLDMPVKQFHEVRLDAHLNDSRLEIERVEGIGQAQGRMTGNLVLEPDGERYRLQTKISARQLRLDLPGSEIDRANQSPIDIDIDIEARGATPHELAGSSNGSVQVVIGKGVMDSQVLDFVAADILLTLLNAFNPFAKQDVATEMQCGVFLVSLEDGFASLEPMALQSDKMTMLGKGKIDFGTEKLDLEWITKPRKGIGISASMLTNPYIKLGGTLADPAIELKPMEAVASTGVAVATMGISLVAKGMLDRVTAEKKVCKKALEEIGRKANGTAKKSKKNRR